MADRGGKTELQTTKAKVSGIPADKKLWRDNANRAVLVGADPSSNIALRENARTPGNTPEHQEVKIAFSESLRLQYTDFLTSYVTNLGKMMASNDPEVRNCLNNLRHVDDRKILTILSKEVIRKNPNGSERVTYEIDQDKVKKFLDTDEGLDMATALMEQQTSVEMYGMALRISMAPRSEREAIMRAMSIHTGDTEGIIRKLWNKYLGPWTGTPMGNTGNRPPDAFGPIGRLPRGINLIPGAQVFLPFEALGYVLNGGVQFNINQCTQVFQSLDAIDRQFLANMSHIHIEDFRLNARGQVELQPAPYTPLTGSFREARDSIVSKLHTRQEYYKALGIRKELLDSLPEQELYNWVNGRMETMKTDRDRRILEAFQALGGPRLVGGNPDIQTNIRLFGAARRQVLREDMNNFITKYAETDDFKTSVDDKRNVNLKAQVDTEVQARTKESGTAIAARTKEYTDAKNNLTTEQGRFDGEFQRLDKYQIAVQGLTEARTAQAAALARVLVWNGAAWVAPADIEAAIQAIGDARTQMAAQVQINGRTINSISARTVIEETWRAAQYTAIDAANPRGANEDETLYREKIQKYRKAVDVEFEARMAPINQENELLQQQLSGTGEGGQVIGLETAQTRVRTSGEALAETTDLVRNFNETVQNQITAYNDISGPWNLTGGALVPPANLTQADLLTLNVTEIMQRINRVNTANAAEGWPASQNNRAERRMQIIRAMNEARARNALPTIANPDPPRLTAMYGVGVTNADVISANNGAALLARRNVIAAARGLPVLPANPGILADYDAARNLVRTRLETRRNAMQENLRVIGEQITEQQDRIDNVDTEFTATRENITLAQEMMDRLGNIMTRSYDFTPQYVGPIGAPISEFVAAINPLDVTLMNAERNLDYIPSAGGVAVPVPRGCLDIYDMLFGYRTEATKNADGTEMNNMGQRNTYLERITRFFPPNELARYLNDNLNLGVVPANLDISNVLAVLRAQINGGRVSALEIRRAFRNIVNDVARRQLATLT